MRSFSGLSPYFQVAIRCNALAFRAYRARRRLLPSDIAPCSARDCPRLAPECHRSTRRLSQFSTDKCNALQTTKNPKINPPKTCSLLLSSPATLTIFSLPPTTIFSTDHSHNSTTLIYYSQPNTQPHIMSSSQQASIRTKPPHPAPTSWRRISNCDTC